MNKRDMIVGGLGVLGGWLATKLLRGRGPTAEEQYDDGYGIDHGCVIGPPEDEEDSAVAMEKWRTLVGPPHAEPVVVHHTRKPPTEQERAYWKAVLAAHPWDDNIVIPDWAKEQTPLNPDGTPVPF